MLIHHKYNANIIEIHCKYTHSTCTSSANTIYSEEYKGVSCTNWGVINNILQSIVLVSVAVKSWRGGKFPRIRGSHPESVFITMAFGGMVFEEINDKLHWLKYPNKIWSGMFLFAVILRFICTEIFFDEIKSPRPHLTKVQDPIQVDTHSCVHRFQSTMQWRV